MAWQKLYFLGAGSYGSVSLAVSLNMNSFLTDSVVAVKSAHTRTTSILALQVEANLLQELRGCPYIVQGLGKDVSFEDGRMVHNLLLEYACLGSLDKIIKNSNGMPEYLVTSYAYMILKGLATLHDKEIVHCDIKPANILVFPLPGLRGISLLKIADLGLSKKVWDWEEDVWCKRRGTPLYQSPEVVMCGLREKAGDIWAVGCTVVEMITGRPLWNDYLSECDLVRQIAYGSPTIPENLSESGKDFLRRCLNKDHNRRWTAKKLLNHPFILDNLKLSGLGAYLRSQKVEDFTPTKPWTCSEGLFSSTILKAQQESDRNYQLFPDDKNRNFRNQFLPPCGAELIATLNKQNNE